MNKSLLNNLAHLQRGITLIELVITVAIAAVILTSLGGVINLALQSEDNVRERNDLTQQARFAMQRMVAAVQGTKRLILPLADNPNTNWREHVREETVPASAPEPDSSKATAVLAVTLAPSIDRDDDGWADANNDKDFMDLNNDGTFDAGEYERIDEDHSDDMNNDGKPGILGIDDDGDGSVDESDAADFPERDDDEEGDRDEDIADGIDDDADGSDGEDATADMNKDFEDGIAGVDDDFDGTKDEGHFHDDDEDGSQDEDWLDAVVFYLSGASLMERIPDINPVDGTSFSAQVVAENVTHFRVERIPQAGGRSVLVDLTLELTGSSGEIVTLQSQVRVGGGL